MGKLKAVGLAILVPAMAVVWACGGGSSSTGLGEDGGGSGQSSGGGGLGPCGAQSCAMGCCDENGVCQAGTSDTVCGTGNIACTDCTALKKTCQMGQCGAGGGTTSSGGGPGSSGGIPFPLFDGGFPFFDAGFPMFDGGFPRLDGGRRGRDAG